jgi:hypothetical protein
MKKKTAPQAFAQVLANDALLCSWHKRMSAEALLNAAIRAELPRPLADRIRVAEAADGTLTLFAAAGAVAAIARQRSSDILAALARNGWNFTEIRVRVQVGGQPLQTQKVLLRQRDRINTAPLKRLASELPAGPLKDALERLSRRAG